MIQDMSATGGGFVEDLRAAASRHPLPAALIGMGLVWLFAGKTGAIRWNVGKGDEAWTGAARADGGAPKLGEAGAGVAQKAVETGSTLDRSVAGLVPSINGGLLGEARSMMADALQRQPLLLGAMGLALGAGVAASLPITTTEAAFLGDASANLQEKARALAMEQSQRAEDAARGLAGSAAAEARRQGLTLEGVRAGIEEVGQKVEKVVDGVTERVS